MITLEQAKVIGSVFKRFNSGETLTWTEMDDCMEQLAWLSEDQLIVEVEVMLYMHDEKKARCTVNHAREVCFVPVVMDACSYIVEDFKSSQRLVKKARYVLEYYLSLSQTGHIIHD